MAYKKNLPHTNCMFTAPDAHSAYYILCSKTTKTFFWHKRTAHTNIPRITEDEETQSYTVTIIIYTQTKNKTKQNKNKQIHTAPYLIPPAIVFDIWP